MIANHDRVDNLPSCKVMLGTTPRQYNLMPARRSLVLSLEEHHPAASQFRLSLAAESHRQISGTTQLQGKKISFLYPN